MKNRDYSLFLDMDGVLVDFDGGFIKLSNGMKPRDMANNYGEKILRDKFISAGIEFWANLNWINGGKELWNASKELFERVYILSSSGTVDSERGKVVREGKILWLKKNMPDMPEQNIFVVNGKHMKKTKASKDGILVDDVSITIKEWNAAGGYGILHNSKYYKTTIETLEDISRPLNLSEILKRRKR